MISRAMHNTNPTEPGLSVHRDTVPDDGSTYATAVAPGGTECWYAVKSKPRQEARAEANLSRLGVHTFLPRETRPTRSRSQPTNAPLFPGYLFVRCDIAATFHKIVYTRGVSKVLGDGYAASPIHDEIIDMIRTRMTTTADADPICTFARGEAVRVTAGPLEDLVGIFEANVKPAERVAILLRTVNSYMRVVVDPAVLQREC
jgi:transcriptional antiterminator RfaH